MPVSPRFVGIPKHARTLLTATFVIGELQVNRYRTIQPVTVPNELNVFMSALGYRTMSDCSEHALLPVGQFYLEETFDAIEFYCQAYIPMCTPVKGPVYSTNHSLNTHVIRRHHFLHLHFSSSSLSSSLGAHLKHTRWLA